ncbi:MAG: D-alanyl-D-alanine carboxypeptidase [Leifsonia xyli]|nr:MAG: D-alanyl-D-alanine carboxypeptidase [Leifsonia xyli]
MCAEPGARHDGRVPRFRALIHRRRHTIVFAVVLLLLAAGITATTSAIGAQRQATAAGERCTADALAARWHAGSLFVDARSARTGKPILTHRGDEPTQTGSTMKVVTAAAAVSALGPDHRFTTSVVAGAEPGAVVLVGGGDPTLSRLPSGQDSVYPHAPHLDDLAEQVLAARGGQPVTAVQVDTALFDGPAWHPSWPESARTSGSVSNITALMVDGDRDDPTESYSMRSAGAVARAATAFAALLGPAVRVDTTSGTAPSGAQVLGSVKSATVSELVGMLLTDSDDTLAEVLARHVAIAEGAGRSFDAVQAGSTKALVRYRVPTEGLRLVDGSGLSPDNRVPASALTTLMRAVAAKQDGLAPVDAGLAVAGRTGTLREHGRFTGAAADARGHVRGKTGTLDDMFGLTGVTDEVAGDRVVFTVFAEGTSDPGARKEIDALAAALWRCGGQGSALQG